MSASRRHRRGAHHHEEEHENEERWLVSFADMMTLLFCLFMVLFAISSVNTSKFKELQKALQDAFSGKILSGGTAVMTTGSAETKAEAPQSAPPLPSLSPLNSANDKASSLTPSKQEQAAQDEQEDFRKLKRRIDQIAKQDGLQGRVETTIDARGLIVRLLTDKVFFDSGQAVIKPGAHKLLDAVAAVIRDEHTHPVVVEGHTDSQPIHSGLYPSNWELSGARAAAVVREFARIGVLQKRMSLAGFASEEPADTNTTAAGRAHNRRVDVVLTRLHHLSTKNP
jgi:chemotaxis protein MotB